jgi:hypothetical protein
MYMANEIKKVGHVNIPDKWAAKHGDTHSISLYDKARNDDHLGTLFRTSLLQILIIYVLVSSNILGMTK